MKKCTHAHSCTHTQAKGYVELMFGSRVLPASSKGKRAVDDEKVSAPLLGKAVVATGTRAGDLCGKAGIVTSFDHVGARYVVTLEGSDYPLLGKRVNGRVGLASSFDTAKYRYVVELDEDAVSNENETVYVKSENLVVENVVLVRKRGKQLRVKARYWCPLCRKCMRPPSPIPHSPLYTHAHRRTPTTTHTRPGHAGGIRCFLNGEEDDNYMRTFVRPLSTTLCKLRRETLETAAEQVLASAVEDNEVAVMNLEE